MNIVHIVLSLGLISLSYGLDVYGVDVSTLTSISSFQCLKGSTPTAYTHVIVRAWKTSGEADITCPQTVANAWAAGLNNVDVYFYPCFSCGAVAAQVQQSVDFLTSHNVTYTTFWLDIEGTWSSDFTTNQIFFEEMLGATVSLGLKVGIYASKYMWTTILGSTYSGASAYPLWYPRYNNMSDFSDFAAFGGWTAPVMKQYQATTPICGAVVDFNYGISYPVVRERPSSGDQVVLAPFSASSWESNIASARAGSKITKCLINGDSYVDLVVAGVSCVYVFLGTSSGTYGSSPDYTLTINIAPAATTDGLGLECADVNQDGFADVLVGNWTSTPSYVHIFNGAANGVSTTPSSLSYTSGGHYYGAALAAADFNKDGKTDLAVGAYGLGRVFIHYGLGAAGLNPTRDAPAVLYTNILTYGQNLAVCDFSNDGYPELVVGARSQNSSRGQLYIYPNTGGTFQAAITRTVVNTNSFFGFDAACGDINGDGKQDLVVLGQGDKLLHIFYGTGSVSTLPATASVILSLVDGARSIAVADQNLDGYADLIVGHNAANKVQIWYGGPSLSSSSTPNFIYQGPSGNSGWSVVHVGNIDGAGRSEFAFGSYSYGSGQANEGQISILYNA